MYIPFLEICGEDGFIRLLYEDRTELSQNKTRIPLCFTFSIYFCSVLPVYVCVWVRESVVCVRVWLVLRVCARA